jgi:hypothetical protein
MNLGQGPIWDGPTCASFRVMGGICECQISHRKSNTYPWNIKCLAADLRQFSSYTYQHHLLRSFALFPFSPLRVPPGLSPFPFPPSSPPSSPLPGFNAVSRLVTVMSTRHTPRQSERDLRVHDSRPPPNHAHPHLNGTPQPPLNTSSIPPQTRSHASPAVSANGAAPTSSVQKLAQANEQTWLLIGSDISPAYFLRRKISV